MKLHFVDSGNIINDVVNSVAVPEEGTEVNLNELSNKQKLKIVSADIDLIEKSITDSVNFHLEHNSFPKITPDNIDIVFTEKNKLKQLLGKLIGRQKAAHVDTTNFNPNHQTISISSDLANFQQFDTVRTDSKVAYKQYNDFTNRLKVEINKFSSNDETLAHARYIQIIFLHELAHTLLNKGFQGTIFLDHFKRDTATSDPVAQFSANVAETFCDGFAGLFMAKQILEEERINGTSDKHFVSKYDFASNIIEAMANARKLSLDLNPPGTELIYSKGFIYQYDCSSFLKELKNNIETLLSLSPDNMLNKLLKMALEHTKTLNDKLMIENDVWKTQFETTLTKYLNSTEFKITSTNINTILDTYFFKPSKKQLTKSKEKKNKM